MINIHKENNPILEDKVNCKLPEEKKILNLIPEKESPPIHLNEEIFKLEKVEDKVEKNVEEIVKMPEIQKPFEIPKKCLHHLFTLKMLI